MYVPLRHKGYAISQSHSIFKSNTQSNFLINNLNTFSMKKLLLASLALVASISMASAADITETFVNSAENGFPLKWDKTNTTPTTITSASTGLKWTVLGSYVATNTYVTPQYDYLMVNGKNVKGAYVSTSLSQACKEISIAIGSGSSTNAKSKINIYGGETLIETITAIPANSPIKVSIPEALRAAGTVYKIESATTSYNQQITSIKFIEPTADATLDTDVKTLDVAVPLNASITKSVKVLAENITGSITATCQNADVKITPATFTAEEGAEGVEITYTGSEADEVSATITFAAGEVKTDVTLSVLVVANEGTEANPLTVNDVIAINSKYDATKPVCVTGVIGSKTAANATNGVLGEADKAAATNIILTQGEAKIGVALPAGDARTKLNIVDNEGNIGKTVVVKGTLEPYFGAPGVKNTEYVSGLSGVENVGVDAEQGVVKYYNLQGVEVANPESGLYIRVQGDKATKVIL